MAALIALTLRLPPELHAALKDRAAEEGRSLHNLIVHLLKGAMHR